MKLLIQCKEDKMIDKNNADHPARQKAIKILERIATYIGNDAIFDCENGNGMWYDLEDIVTNIVLEKP